MAFVLSPILSPDLSPKASATGEALALKHSPPESHPPARMGIFIAFGVVPLVIATALAYLAVRKQPAELMPTESGDLPATREDAG